MNKILNYNHSYLHKAVLYIALSFIALSPLFSQDEVLKGHVQKEFDSLKGLSQEWQTHLEFNETDGLSSESQAAKGIVVVNIPELRNIINTTGQQYETDLIRMLLAHELGHQIQYRYYNNITGGLLFECQADIIAGFLIYQLLAEDLASWQEIVHLSSISDPRLIPKLTELNTRMLADFTAIFGVGTLYILRPSHPTNEERRMSLRDGFTYGNVWLYGEVLANSPTVVGGLTKQEIKEMADNYKQIMNYLPGDNLVTWSYRHAKKIIHSSQSNCRDIAVYTDFEWDTSASNPYLSYSHAITNVGQKVITLSFYNQLYTVKRDDPVNTLYWVPVATSPHSLTLQPGERKSLSGKLKWKASKDFMPSFVYLGSEGSLYSCTALTDKDEAEGGIKQFADNKKVSDDVILDILFTSRQDFRKYIGSVGQIYEKDDMSSIEYLSRIRIPSAEYTTIVNDTKDGQYFIEAKFYASNSDVAAEKTRQKLLNVLSKINLSTIENISEEDKRTRVWDISDPSGKIGEVTVTHLMFNSTYSVGLEIFGEKDK